MREQIDLELASLTRIASEAADVATTKAGEAVDAKNVVVLRADEVDGHAVILYGLFDEIEDYRQEVYSRALESIEQANLAAASASQTVSIIGSVEELDETVLLTYANRASIDISITRNMVILTGVET